MPVLRVWWKAPGIRWTCALRATFDWCQITRVLFCRPSGRSVRHNTLRYLKLRDRTNSLNLPTIVINGRLITRVVHSLFAWQHHRRSPAGQPRTTVSGARSRAIIDHMYNAALYSGGLRRWCCRPTFTSRPFTASARWSAWHNDLEVSLEGGQIRIKLWNTALAVNHLSSYHL